MRWHYRRPSHDRARRSRTDSRGAKVRLERSRDTVVCLLRAHGIYAVTRKKRPRRSTVEPKAWWQRVIAGERLPNGMFNAKSKCDGTIEDHRTIALDVRELIRKHVFEQPVGSVLHLNLRFPWLRMMRLNSSSLDLKLVTGRTVDAPSACGDCDLYQSRCLVLLHSVTMEWKPISTAPFDRDS